MFPALCHCVFLVVLMIHCVRDAVKQFSGLSNDGGAAPKCSLKHFIVMISEACGAQHCVCMIECNAKVWHSTTQKIPFQLSLMGNCTARRELGGRPAGFQVRAT